MPTTVTIDSVRSLWIILSASIACAFAQENIKPRTFLDTLNKGREVAVTSADYNLPDSFAQSRNLTLTTPISAQQEENPDELSYEISAELNKKDGEVISRFRIQVLASTAKDQVKIEKNKLAGQIDFPVSITFEAPYYKLFVGDFALRDEAENYLERLKNLGYNDAWIVRIAVK